MCQIKSLFDPQNKLNPGVIISEDEIIHLKNLKTSPTVEEEVDRCVECGYCEPACPSKNLTLTPRQRIVIRREMQRATNNGDLKTVVELKKDYGYESLDTCAVDGMCGTACPVLINTGDLVRRLRSEEMGIAQKAGWSFLAKNWSVATRAISSGLSVAKAIPGFKAPLYSKDLPRGGSARQIVHSSKADAIYFPSCTSSIFDSHVREAFLALASKVGLNISTPEGIDGLCCGQPWKSKGADSGYSIMKEKSAQWMREATNNGAIPLISDASSCTDSLRAIGESVDVLDFVVEKILPILDIKKLPSIAVHPTCGSTKAGANGSFYRLARAISDEVFTPKNWSCCAFAGDRGALVPELTASATEKMAEEINSRTFSAYVSNNRTCEIGMTRATSHPYRHIIEVLVEQLQ